MMLNEEEEEAFRILIHNLEGLPSNKWEGNLHLEIYATLDSYRSAFKKAIDSLQTHKQPNYCGTCQAQLPAHMPDCEHRTQNPEITLREPYHIVDGVRYPVKPSKTPEDK